MKNIKKLLFTFFAIFTILGLTGCSNQESSLVINDDDTSTLTYVITLDKDKYDLLSSYGIDTNALNQHKNTSSASELDNIDALFQEVAAAYVQYGFSVSPIEDTVEIGFKAERKYMSLDELNTSIKELKNANLSNVDFEITKFSNSFGTKYQCYGNLVYVMDPDIDFNNMQIAEDFDTMIGKDSLTSTFSVFMPASTSVSATDGTYEGSTLKWTAKGNNETEIAVHVISENKNTGMYAIVIIGIIIVIVIIGLFVSRYIKKITDRRNSTDLEDNDPDTYDVDDDEDDEFEED